jgi:ribonuclease HII
MRLPSEDELYVQYARRGSPMSWAVEAALRSDARQDIQYLWKALEHMNSDGLRDDRTWTMVAHERGLREQGGFDLIAGVAVVGSTAWAGPIIGAAVVFPRDVTLPGIHRILNLAPALRPSLGQQIRSAAIACTVGHTTAKEIDESGLPAARRLAMRRAVEGLRPTPDALIVNGVELPEWTHRQVSVVRGELVSVSVAGAMLVAKLARDAYMSRLHDAYPNYGFEVHAGYGVRTHREALREYGSTPEHRRSFIPVRKIISGR